MVRVSWVYFAAVAGLCFVGAGVPSPVLSAEGAVPLVWHVETDDGRVLDSRESDRAVNPASVVKLATSFRALESLGADYRFETGFAVTAVPGQSAAGLVVEGGRDPDFHFENAVLVARSLREAGVEKIDGNLHVGSGFWIGWERGSAGRETDAVRRRIEMGRRLVSAWSPSTWGVQERAAWKEMAARRGWDEAAPPELKLGGAIVGTADLPPRRTVVVHRSQPLMVILRRFNVFSNNDIERLDETIGAAGKMSEWMVQKWGDAATSAAFSTSSGLDRNRMTPRLVVRLLRDLRSWLQSNGRAPADLLPVLGCGESTLQHLFPRLRESREADGLAGKTGTLNTTDGGVSALAGYLPAGPGLVFFVAAPGAGDRLPRARAAEEDWVRKVLLRHGSVAPLSCPAPVPTSDQGVEIRREAGLAALGVPVPGRPGCPVELRGDC